MMGFALDKGLGWSICVSNHNKEFHMLQTTILMPKILLF